MVACEPTKKVVSRLVRCRIPCYKNAGSEKMSDQIFETQTPQAPLLVRGGLVFDGSGRPPQTADVLGDQERVAAVGPALQAPAHAEVIDAAGCWVTPGFIDLHTHYDAELELDPALGESLRHGVTTVLVGSCGLSFAVGSCEDLADQFC